MSDARSHKRERHLFPLSTVADVERSLRIVCGFDRSKLDAAALLGVVAVLARQFEALTAMRDGIRQAQFACRAMHLDPPDLLRDIPPHVASRAEATITFSDAPAQPLMEVLSAPAKALRVLDLALTDTDFFISQIEGVWIPARDGHRSRDIVRRAVAFHAHRTPALLGDATRVSPLELALVAAWAGCDPLPIPSQASLRSRSEQWRQHLAWAARARTLLDA